MNICVFCSGNDLDEGYVRPARELAKLLGKAGHSLVWGGSDCGLMKVMADGVQESGGKIIGISTVYLKHLAHKTADEMIFTKDIAERKKLMLERAEAIVVLPGGLGTLDEITDALELKRHRALDCSIIILDTDNFYKGLKLQLQHMAERGFLPGSSQVEEWVVFADTPRGVLDLIMKAVDK